MAATKVPAIYKVPSKVDPELKRYLESVQEAIEVRLGRRGDELDRAITLRELISSGLASDLKSAPFNPNNPEVQTFQPKIIYDGTIPPLPTGFSASGAFRTITLEWDMPPMANFAYSEIWRSEDSFVENAVRVDTTLAFVWSDTVAYASTYYYWVNFVSTSDVIGPKTGPKSATTSADVGAVMGLLSEDLSALPGYSTLNNAITANTNAIVLKKNVYRASSAPSGGTYATGDLWVDTDDNQIYQWNGSAWTSARDTGLATDSELNTVSSAVTNAQNTADGKIKTFAQDGIPTSVSAGDIWLDTNDNNKIYIAEAAGADAITSGEWVARDDSRIASSASSVSTLTSTTNTLTGYSQASYVLQVNSNGHIAGLSVQCSTSTSGQVSSNIIFQGDKIFMTNSSGATPVAAFVVDGNSVFINSAYIQDGSIVNAKIADATIDSAKIANLSATKIAAGSIETVAITIGASTGARVELDGGNSRIVVIDNSA